MHTPMYTHTHMYTHTYTTHPHTRMHTHKYTRTHTTHAHTDTDTHTHTHTLTHHINTHKHTQVVKSEKFTSCTDYRSTVLLCNIILSQGPCRGAMNKNESCVSLVVDVVY